MFSRIFNSLGSNAFVRKLVSKLNLSPKTLSKLMALAKPRKSKAAMIREMHSQIGDLNFKINLLMDYYFDPAKAMKAQGRRALEQANMLDLICELDRICKKLEVPYWLDFGTLLGAQRHAGFVPWDDDADCGMLYDDMAAKIDLIKQEISPRFEFSVRTADVKITCGRIINKDKSFESHLDVFAYEDLGDKMRAMLTSFKIPNINDIVPKKLILPTSKILFEGKELSAPADVDFYLRGRYGNYHLLPKKAHVYLENWDVREKFFKD